MHSDTVDAKASGRADREAMKASGYVASLEAHTTSLRELVDAIDALIDTPAPDIAGAIRKLEIAIEHDLNGGGLSPLLDDLRRHTGRAE